MFQSVKMRIRAGLSLLDDVLGDREVVAVEHPHRRELRWERQRRGGSVPARPALCVSPVRSRREPGRRSLVV